MVTRIAGVNVAWIGLTSFAFYMLIDRLWAHSPLPIAIMAGFVVAVFVVGTVPVMTERLRRWKERKGTGI